MIAAELDIRAELLAPERLPARGNGDCARGHRMWLRMHRAPAAGRQRFTTVEFKANFLGTALEGTIACVARPAHLGNTRRSGTPSSPTRPMAGRSRSSVARR